LKAARERKGVTLAEIADVTKVPGWLFAALERSDVGRWPKGLFRRSFFRGYATMIGVQVDEACEAFARLFPDEEIVAPAQIIAPPPGLNVKIKTRWWH
jgi:cytoskeletal protein RodZ